MSLLLPNLPVPASPAIRPLKGGRFYVQIPGLPARVNQLATSSGEAWSRMATAR
jgi:hypothetical protein